MHQTHATPEPTGNTPPSLTAEEVKSIALLGSVLVRHLQEATAAIVMEGDELFAGKPLATVEATTRLIAAKEVSDERHVLGVFMERPAQDAFARSIDALHVPKFLRVALDAKDSAHVVERVLRSHDRPQTVANFFEWYNHTLEKRKEVFDKEEKPRLVSDFELNLQKAERKGTIPSYLRQRWARKQEQGKVHVELVGITLSPTGSPGSASHFKNGDELVLLTIADNERKVTFTHEGLHALEGDATEPIDEAGHQEETDRGLNRLFGKGEGARALNEAVIEHTTDSILHGNVDVVWPRSKERKNTGMYEVNRLLLYILCEKGLRPIHPRAFIDATFEDGKAQESPAIRSLQSQIDIAFPGMDVIGSIGRIKASDVDTLVRFAADFHDRWLELNS